MRTALLGEFWGVCQRCGERLPMSKLTKKTGAIRVGTYGGVIPDPVVEHYPVGGLSAVMAGDYVDLVNGEVTPSISETAWTAVNSGAVGEIIGVKTNTPAYEEEKAGYLCATCWDDNETEE